MDLLSIENLRVNDFNLEVVGVKNEAIKNYPPLHKGYVFHFFVGDGAISTFNDDSFKMSLDFSWKFSFPGPLNKLEERLESFKNSFIQNKDLFYEDVDQFGYLVMFIVQHNNIYELVISSESFGIDKVIKNFNWN